MKRKVFLGLALSMAISVASVGGLTLGSHAAETEAAAEVTPTPIVYGKLTKHQLEMVASGFDSEFYAKKYEDVVTALGTDQTVLFNHFVKCGIWEGRQGWPDFNPSAYASAYSDLQAAFGSDIIRYYEHYYFFGKSEGRNLTTIEACMKAGIKVTPLVQDGGLIDQEIKAASNLMPKPVYASSGSSSSSSGSSSSSSSSKPTVVDYHKTSEGYVKQGILESTGHTFFRDDNSRALYIIRNEDGSFAILNDEDADESTVNQSNCYGAIAVSASPMTKGVVDLELDYMLDGLASVDGDLNNYLGDDQKKNYNTIMIDSQYPNFEQNTESDVVYTNKPDRVTGDYTGNVYYKKGRTESIVSVNATHQYVIDKTTEELASYEIGTITKQVDDKVQVTLIITNTQNGEFEYTATYTFDGRTIKAQ
jgi:hypothetical protein